MSLDLRQTKFLTSAAASGDLPPDHGAEVAFAGRSNAGKSTALNALTGVSGLARASKMPGRTQLINFFAVGPNARLVDLPGYGFAKVPVEVRATWEGMLEDYLAERVSLRGLVLVMDIRHPLKDLDLQLLDWARGRALPVHALLTKADKLSKAQADRTGTEVAKSLQAASGAGTGVTVFSATAGTGRDAARKAVLTWLNDPVHGMS
jgi:GTP-binding protein